MIDAAHNKVRPPGQQSIQSQLDAICGSSAAMVDLQAFLFPQECYIEGADGRDSTRRTAARPVWSHYDDVAKLLHESGQDLYALSFHTIVVRDKYQGSIRHNCFYFLCKDTYYNSKLKIKNSKFCCREKNLRCLPEKTYSATMAIY
jgi:hypothetical protein